MTGAGRRVKGVVVRRERTGWVGDSKLVAEVQLAPYTLHPSLYALRPTDPSPFTLHPTPFNLHPAPYPLPPSTFIGQEGVDRMGRRQPAGELEAEVPHGSCRRSILGESGLYDQY